MLIAVPSFALGVILKYIFSIKFGWFPQRYVATDPLVDQVHSMILPALTLALPAAAVYQRLLRTDLITTLQEDFILMARSKGVSRRAVLFKHACDPRLFSFITVFGINTGALIGGALVVEQIFMIPGLGSAVTRSRRPGGLPGRAGDRDADRRRVRRSSTWWSTSSTRFIDPRVHAMSQPI